MTTITEVGAEIRRRRLAKGLSIESLSKRAGISANHIGQIEIGHVDAGLDVLRQIARALRCEVGQLFGEVKPLTKKGHRFGKLFHKASPELQHGLLAFLRAVNERRDP